jgi:hypothetical protein
MEIFIEIDFFLYFMEYIEKIKRIINKIIGKPTESVFFNIFYLRIVSLCNFY